MYISEVKLIFLITSGVSIEVRMPPGEVQNLDGVIVLIQISRKWTNLQHIGVKFCMVVRL